MKIFEPDTTFFLQSGKSVRGFLVSDCLADNIRSVFQERINHKLDNIFIVAGDEGSGKTVFATTMARSLDPTFPGELLPDGSNRRTCDRIVFYPEELAQRIEESKVGQSIVLDEAILSLGSQDAGNDYQRKLIKLFATCRYRRLNIFLVMPNFFMMRRPIACYRSVALFDIRVRQGFQRGYIHAYNKVAKNKLYVYGIKEHNMNAVPPTFIGRFNNTEGMFYDINEYTKKKNDAVRNIISEQPDEQKKEILRRTEIYQKIMYHHYSIIEDIKKQQIGRKYVVNDYCLDLKRLLGIECDRGEILRWLNCGKKFLFAETEKDKKAIEEKKKKIIDEVDKKFYDKIGSDMADEKVEEEKQEEEDDKVDTNPEPEMNMTNM